ncbi:MAG: SGNH/GDSL hydrolase family protein [Actinobacteria bacterium]|nr:SGNH/GDSL hydrolase family protein [Actinomycetota bacterium]
MIRRRAPATIITYIALISVVLVIGFVEFGLAPAWLLGSAVLAGAAVGLHLGIRLVWFLAITFHVVNLLATVGFEPRWSTVLFQVALLALLLAPPSRRHFRRQRSEAQERGSRAGRVLRLAATVLAGLLLGLVVYGALLAPGPVSGDLELVRGDRPGLRVLFVGNALTSNNAMPRTVRRLGDSQPGGEPIFAVRYAKRGAMLEKAVDDDRLAELLDDERWDFVVLQEHSQVASQPAEREDHMLAAAIGLDRMAKRAGARTVLFANPGYEDGDRDKVPGDTYEAMQQRLSQAYLKLASTLSATLAPLGAAWAHARRTHPYLELWSDDGIRPSEAGSYLTACVLYAVLTNRDPTGSRFDAGLDLRVAQQLPRIAEQIARPRS